jgi:hypothetical protein
MNTDYNQKIQIMKQLFYLIGIVLLSASCSDMYDNVKDFADKETVYPGKFDFAHPQIGYERVEIDLLNAGRIPASEIYLGKAHKTVIEYGEEPIVIDSICSWVNITGLNQSRLYTFKIYTVDQYGNKSVPVETTATPYLEEDLNTLIVSSPRIIASPWKATLDWPNGLSSLVFDYYGLSYSYLDRNGQKITGTCGADATFAVENQAAESDVNISVKYKILPHKNDKPILDTLELVRPIDFKLPDIEGYKKNLISRNISSLDFNGLITVKWEEVTNYTLKRTILNYFDRSNPGNPVERTVTVENSESSTVIEGAKLGDVATLQSVFMPDGSYEEVTANPMTYRFPESAPLNRSQWEIVYLSSTDGAEINNPKLMWDNSGSVWHSQWNGSSPPPPHIIVIDLKYDINITGVDVRRRNYETGDTKTIECYSGNSREHDASDWIKIGEGAFPDNNKDNNEINIPMPTNTASGRYLKIVMPDSFRYPYCNIAEIFGYGK